MPTVYTPVDQFPGGAVTVPANGDTADADGVCTPIWETSLDRNLFCKNRITEIMVGTRSVEGLTIDGMGDQVVAAPTGLLVTTGDVTTILGSVVSGSNVTAASELVSNATVAASTVPNTIVSKGFIFNDSPPLAWCNTSGSGHAFNRGMNIHAYSRSAQGVFVVTLGINLANAAYAVPSVTLLTGGVFYISSVVTAIVSSRLVLTVTIIDSTLTAQDADFALVVFGG